LSERRSAARGVISGFAEGQGAKKADGRVEKRESIGPGDVRGRVWGSNGVEQDTGTEVDGTVRVAGKAMPKEPPSAGWVGERSVVGVFANKMAVVGAVGSTVSRGRGK
jgi:hypothetical protein